MVVDLVLGNESKQIKWFRLPTYLTDSLKRFDSKWQFICESGIIGSDSKQLKEDTTDNLIAGKKWSVKKDVAIIGDILYLI